MWFNKKSVGLVLGGGGVRGFFHIGVIKAIQELGITIDKISGTSIGAVVGAMYAANPQLNFEKLVWELDYFTLVKTMTFQAKLRSISGLESLLRTYLSATTFAELKIPFCFNTTDINHREEVVFDKGKLFPGLLAAISVPGVFSPVKINNRYLVDGGVMNNVPVSLVKSAKRLIVSDITGPIKKIDDKTLAINILYSSIALMQYRIGQEEMKQAKHQQITYLSLDDDNIFILDFRKKNYRGLIDLGYQAMINSGF